jgi:hypothetical protein
MQCIHMRAGQQYECSEGQQERHGGCRSTASHIVRKAVRMQCRQTSKSRMQSTQPVCSTQTKQCCFDAVQRKQSESSQGCSSQQQQQGKYTVGYPSRIGLGALSRCPRFPVAGGIDSHDSAHAGSGHDIAGKWQEYSSQAMLAMSRPIVLYRCYLAVYPGCEYGVDKQLSCSAGQRQGCRAGEAVVEASCRDAVP